MYSAGEEEASESGTQVHPLRSTEFILLQPLLTEHGYDKANDRIQDIGRTIRPLGSPGARSEGMVS